MVSMAPNLGWRDEPLGDRLTAGARTCRSRSPSPTRPTSPRSRSTGAGPRAASTTSLLVWGVGRRRGRAHRRRRAVDRFGRLQRRGRPHPGQPGRPAVPLRLDRLLGDRGRLERAPASGRPAAGRRSRSRRRRPRARPRPASRPRSPRSQRRRPLAGHRAGRLRSTSSIPSSSCSAAGSAASYPFVRSTARGRARSTRPARLRAASSGSCPRRSARTLRCSGRRSSHSNHCSPIPRPGCAPATPWPPSQAPESPTAREEEPTRPTERSVSDRRSLSGDDSVIAFGSDPAVAREACATRRRSQRCPFVGSTAFLSVVFVLAACTTEAVPPRPRQRRRVSRPPARRPPARRPRPLRCTVGVSWNNFQQPRWAAHDEPDIKDTVEAGGGTYISADANLSTEQQLTDVDTLISQGAKVLIILAQDTTVLGPALQKAKDAGIPVIAYDRLIEDPEHPVHHVRQRRRRQGRGRGHPGRGPDGQLRPDQGRPGRPERLDLPARRAGTRPVSRPRSMPARSRSSTGLQRVPGVAEDYGTYTDAWATETAQANMEAIIDKAVADGTHDRRGPGRERQHGARRRGCPHRQELRPYPPVSGQDGDPANLNNVAKGLQFVDVWKNANELGKAAGAAALALCAGGDMASLTLPGRPHRPGRRSDRWPHRPGVRDAGRQQRQLVHPPADPADGGEPAAGHRRWPGHQGRRCAPASTPRQRPRPASSGLRPLS